MAIQAIKDILQESRESLTQQQSLTVSSEKTTELAHWGTKEEFLVKVNPSYQMEICHDADNCILGEFPTLAELKASYGSKFPTAWLIPQLNNLSEFCGVRDKLQGRALVECAFTIAAEFYYLKVSELMLFFHRFKSGRYGRFYGNVDPIVITTSLRTFLTERSYVLQEAESRQAEKRRAERSKGCVTWEEYCRQTGQMNRINDSPLKQ